MRDHGFRIGAPPLALVAVVAIVVAGCGSHASQEPNPYPPPPDIRGLSLDDAFERLAEAGWQRFSPAAGIRCAHYDTNSADGGSLVGRRRYGEFKLVCGASLDDSYRLHVYLARRSSECGRMARRFTRPVPSLVVVDRRQSPPQYFAIWGWAHPYFHPYPDLAGYPLYLIEPGTCAHPAAARAYHLGGAAVETLRTTTWALRWGQKCLTHVGARVLPSDTTALRDSGRTRRIEAGRLVITARDGRVVVQKLDARRTSIRPDLFVDSSSGSGLYAVHLRPGTCTHIVAPEMSLIPSGWSRPTVVPIPFERLVQTPHVIEVHDATLGNHVAACVRLDGPAK